MFQCHKGLSLSHSFSHSFIPKAQKEYITSCDESEEICGLDVLVVELLPLCIQQMRGTLNCLIGLGVLQVGLGQLHMGLHHHHFTSPEIREKRTRNGYHRQILFHLPQALAVGTNVMVQVFHFMLQPAIQKRTRTKMRGRGERGEGDHSQFFLVVFHVCHT